MYKIFIKSAWSTMNAAAVHTLVIEFSTKEEADAAYEKLTRFDSWTKAIRLY